jgi:hypothetical protein
MDVKPKKSVQYFTQETENAIVAYNLATDFSIKEKIDKKFWDSKNQKVKTNWQNSHNINILLNTIKNKVDIIRLDYKTKGERLTSTLLRHELTKVIYGNDEALFSIY